MAMAEIEGVAHRSIKTHNRILLNKIPKKKNTDVQSSVLFSLFLLTRSARIWPFGPSRTIFLSRLNSRWRIKQKNKTKIYICFNKFSLYILFCFILLFTSSSPCRKDQIVVLWFSTSYYCTAPGLLLGVPAPLNRMLLWACWYFILSWWATLIIITIIVTIIWATVSCYRVSRIKANKGDSSVQAR